MIHIVFDVESIGLHGEGYAVGYVVCDSHCMPVAEGMFACPSMLGSGQWANHLWVRNLEYTLRVDCETPKEVRNKFWGMLRHWVDLDKDSPVYLWADCGWPVEARFLLACIEDDPIAREWQGPYPLMDIAPLAYFKGLNPTDQWGRLENELPLHNPLNDARQSTRILRSLLWNDPQKPNIAMMGG